MRTIIPKDAKLIPPEAKLVFKGVIFDVYQWQQKMFDDSMATFEMLRRPGTVKVFAVQDGKIAVLDDEQPWNGHSCELPGGRHDVKEKSELDCAKRELHEETGKVFRTWKLLKVQQKHNKIESFLYLFLATDLERQEEPHIDAGERIGVKMLTFDELLKMCQDEHNRYLPKELLEQVGSLDGLLAMPIYR
jgi:ADP-ribose pyrophosphatase